MKKFQKWNTLDVNKLIRVNEAVAVDKYLKAVKLVSNLVGRRIGQKIYVSPLAQTVQKSGGDKLSGVYGVFGDKQLRYNWKLSGSADIISVDIWNKIKPNPDITVELNDIPLVKCVDTIAQSIIQGKPIGDQVLEERVNPKTAGKVSQNIADAIRQWAVDMDVDDGKLEKTRISHLFNDFEYWRLEVTEEDFKPVSKASFRNYIVEYINKAGLKNVFMRVVTSSKAKGEKVVVDAKQSSSFNKAIYSMSLEDQFDLAENSIISVLKGYKTTQGIFSSVGGIGKTTLVQNILKSEGLGKFKKKVIIKGGISKPVDLYKRIYNDRKDTLFILDDVEAVLKKSSEWQDLSKSLFDSQKERIVSYYDDIKKLGDVPSEFNTNAGFIILSNADKDKLPSAIQRRLTPIQIEGTKQEIIDRIRVNLKDVFPEVEMDIKLEVLDFIEAHIKDVSQIEFSSFQTSCIYRLAEGNTAWKKQVLFILRNV